MKDRQIGRYFELPEFDGINVGHSSVKGCAFPEVLTVLGGARKGTLAETVERSSFDSDRLEFSRGIGLPGAERRG